MSHKVLCATEEINTKICLFEQATLDFSRKINSQASINW